MRDKTLRFITAAVVSVSLALPASALEQTPPDKPTTIVISQIYPNGIGSNERDGGDDLDEFISLHNPTDQALTLFDATIGFIATGKEDLSKTLELPEITLQPGQSVSLFATATAAPLFSLTNGGGTLVLMVANSEVQRVTYPSLGEDESFAFDATTGEWTKTIPTPSPTLPEPVEPEISEPPATNEPGAPICVASNVTISEILANPSGADTAGGEFVELYNNSDQAVNLDGCWLKTDKLAKFELTDRTIEPKGYTAINLADKLLNGGGQVWFVTTETEEITNYPALSDDQVWVLINEQWQLSSQPTPNATNVANVTPIDEEASKDNSLQPCPEGKYRNPETNRCKNIETASNALNPCEPGYFRNTQTNRCNKIAASSTTLTPCQSGYQRNPETNRCRKVTTAVSGQNGSTNAAENAAVIGTQTIDTKLLAPVAIAAVMYGLYEYRYDAQNVLRKLRTRRVNKQ